MAEIVATILGPPITELCKCSFYPFKRKIGYIVHYKKKFEKLKKKVEELKQMKDGVQAFVTAAQRNLESIHKVVEEWLVKVEKKTSTLDGVEDEVVNMMNTKCWCSCDIGSRYSLGKKVARKMIIIDELLNYGKAFNRDNISEPFHLIGTNPMPTNNLNDFVSFASREHLKDEVMAALRDEGTNLIVVHGMGGVGKTTLVNQVYDHLVNKEKNLFVDIVKTVISRNFDLIKIQNDVAEVLGLKELETKKNATLRAEMLSKRLMQNSALVILDDLWSPLKFSDVGIPCEGRCKVIITTRKLDVCTSFPQIKLINVQVLSEADSWHLFKTMNVGDDLKHSSEMEETARKVVKECQGLPVALVTLGRALRNKKKHVFDSALHELETSNIRGIDEEMDRNVYSSIKLSYDYLGNEILKNCFLLCCLFPEDHIIYIRDVMMYVMGDGTMFDDEETLKQRTDKVCTILDKLVDSCLLLSDEGGTYFWMHDVVRDVAINVASQESHGFLVRAKIGLEGWTTNSDTAGKCLRRLSLMKNKISVLPENPPQLPHLLSLALYGNTSLMEIPKSFFERMESLTTLDLRETGISFLPSSFSSLVNLKMLYLDGCKFNQPSDINIIGKLKKLELLSLAYCDLLSGLPEELSGLTNLRLLNVESYYYRVFTIPRNVIGSLSRLEYLNTRRCDINWEFEGWGNGRNASLEEVASLRYLAGLELRIYNGADVSKENLKCGHVKKFDISFSDATGILMMSLNPLRKCYVDLSPPVCRPIKVLIQRVEILTLRGSLKSLGRLGGGFNNLKELDLLNCKEMEYLMSAEEAESPRPFVALEKLTLSSLDKLKEIFDDNSGIRSAPNLKSLKVSDCKGLKDVFNLNNNNIEEVGLSDVVTFSRLRKMELFGLSILENIWKGHNIPFGCFENLEELRVSNCEKLRYLFSPYMARNLQNLKLFQISYCENLKQLWEKEDDVDVDGDDDDDDQVAGRASILDFPALESLKVLWCKNLKRIRLTHRCTKQLKEIKVDDDKWRIEWEEPSDKLRLQSLFQQLESILDMAQGVWSDNFELQLEFTTRFRIFLSSENVDRIEKVIKACVVPRFVEFLEKKDLSQLQHEAARALTIITSGTSEYTQVVIDHDDVHKKALSALGCVDGDLVLDQGAFLPLMSQFNEHLKLSMLRNATLTLSEFCNTQSLFEQVEAKLVLLALRHLIHSTDDEQVLTDACWALRNLIINGNIKAVIDVGVFPRLLDLLLHPSKEVAGTALGIVCNIVIRDDDAQMQYVVDNYQVQLPCLYQLLTQNPNEIIKTFACGTISFITCGGKNNRGHRIQIFGQPRMH